MAIETECSKCKVTMVFHGFIKAPESPVCSQCIKKKEDRAVITLKETKESKGKKK